MEEPDFPRRDPKRSTDAFEFVFSRFDSGMYAISFVGSKMAYFNVLAEIM